MFHHTRNTHTLQIRANARYTQEIDKVFPYVFSSNKTQIFKFLQAFLLYTKTNILNFAATKYSQCKHTHMQMKHFVYYLYIIILLSSNSGIEAKVTTFIDINNAATSSDYINKRNSSNSLYSVNTAIVQYEQLKHLRWLSIVMFLFLLFLSIIMVYYFKIKRTKYNSYMEDDKIKYAKLLRSYQDSLKEEESLKSSINKIQQDKDAEIQELKDMLSTYTDDINESSWDKEHFLSEHEIVSHMHSLAVKVNKPSSKEWSDLRDIVKKMIPNFITFIMRQEFKLTEKELQVCILTRLSFTPSEIGILIGASKQRVSNLRSILNKRLFNETGAKTFSQNLYSI